MPQALDVAFYQLGIRVTQCRVLHERCTNPAYTSYGDAGDAATIALLRFMLVELEAAYKLVARVGELDPVRAEMGLSLIRHAQEFWSFKGERMLKYAKDACPTADDEIVGQSLRQLEEHILRNVIPAVQPFTSSEIWFSLGQEISNFYVEHSPPWIHPSTIDTHLAQSRELNPWNWGNVQYVNESLSRLDVRLEDLTHTVTEGVVKDFPPFVEPQRKYWLKLEAGLAILFEQHQSLFDSHLQSLSKTADESMTDSSRRDLGTRQIPEEPKAILANDARDSWLYKQACTIVKGKLIPYKTIATNLAKIAKSKGWTKISDPKAIKNAANRWAKRNGKPLIPRRQNGRPKNK